MMVFQYKEKPNVVNGIEVASASIQAGAVAEMIGAVSFSVSVNEGSATFKLDGRKEVTVTDGQVVTVQGSDVVVYSADDFRGRFEPYA